MKGGFARTGIFRIICFTVCFIFSTLIYADTVRVGIYNNSPKVFIDENGRAQGIFIDIFEYIAEKEHWKIEYVFGTWAEQMDFLLKDKVDILADVAWSESRDSLFSFHQILVIQSWLQVFTHGNIQLNKTDDLAGKRIGVLSGSVQEEFFREHFSQLFGVEIYIVSFDDYKSTVQALDDHIIDAMVADRFFYYSDIKTDSIVATSLLFQPRGLFFTTRKGVNLYLLDAIDEHLFQLKNDPGSLYYNSLRAHLDSVSNQDRLLYLKWIFIITGIIVILSVAISLILRNRIRAKTKELILKNRELEEKERNYREIFNSTREAIYIHDIDTGAIIDVNQTMIDLYGYSNKEEALDIATRTMNYPSDSEFSFERALEKLKETKLKGSVSFEWLARRKNGEDFWVDIRLIKTTIAGTERILAFVRDINDRKRMEKEVESATALFHTLALNSPVGIFRTNAKGETIYVNPAWSQLTGVSKEEAYGYGWARLIHPDERDVILKEWNERFEKKIPSNTEYRLLKNNGSVVWVLGNAVPDYIGDEFQGYVGTMTDITLVKEAELEIQKKNEELIIAKENAEESNRLKSSFLANLSHEIRTPMNAIAGFASLLEKTIGDDEKLKKFGTIIHQSSIQLLSIINDIVEISMIETRQMSLKYQDVELKSFFEHLFSIFRTQIPENRNVEILFRLSEELLNFRLNTDPVKFEQIFCNLIGNSLKFTEHGSIEIICQVQNEKALLFTVKDTGIGIHPDEHNKVFDRFYRCENEINVQKGSGLGLAITKAYVEMLGGEIFLTSEPGAGTEFSFTTPYKGSNKTEEKEDTFTPVKLSNDIKPKVLIVEDEEVNVLFLRTALSDFDIEIHETAYAKESVELCREHKDFKLILMDVKLKDGSGIDATMIIKKEFPDIPVIVQTAYALREDQLKAQEAGCDDFLPKPISLKKLREIAAKYLFNS